MGYKLSSHNKQLMMEILHRKANKKKHSSKHTRKHSYRLWLDKIKLDRRSYTTIMEGILMQINLTGTPLGVILAPFNVTKFESILYTFTWLFSTILNTLVLCSSLPKLPLFRGNKSGRLNVVVRIFTK